MRSDLASGILNGVEEFRNKYPTITKPEATVVLPVQSVISALDEFMESVRYLNTRRSGTTLNLDSEAAVQDALYLMLRPWIHDLVPETPTEKIANRFSIKDFASRQLRVVIEAKYIRDKDHGKSISREINDDIENYRYHPYCDFLLFFIYDPNSYIPDGGAVVSHVSQPRTYGEKILKCFCVIKP